jgi:hypothetical protein
MINKLVEEAPYHPGYEDVGFKSKMNANELADKLEHTMRHRTDTVFTQAANMLRQQQTEIKCLSKKYKEQHTILIKTQMEILKLTKAQNK